MSAVGVAFSLVLASGSTLGVAQAEQAQERIVANDLERVADSLAAADEFSGAVLLARNGEVLLETAYGDANKDFAVPNRVDTKFNLGSMNKMFTAVAIAQLVERGVISFEDSLGKFLPGFPTDVASEQVRVKHLLSHTSGIGDYFTDEFMRTARANLRNIEDMLPLLDGRELLFEPGTEWRYSNGGFLLLGRIIEVVSGQDYHDYIREHITGPLEMTNTDTYQLDHVNPNLAVGYHGEDTDSGRVYTNNIFAHVIRGGPAGGGYSTVRDLFRFSEALRSGTLVSREMVRTLTTAKPEIGSPRYGYGFIPWPDGQVGHSGGFIGINSYLMIWMDSGWTLAVMSNYSGGSTPVMRALVGMLNSM